MGSTVPHHPAILDAELNGLFKVIVVEMLIEILFVEGNSRLVFDVEAIIS